MSRTMKALIFHGPGDVRLEERPLPALTHPEDAIVKVTLTTICGTDLHPYRGSEPREAGSPIGHECVGVVERVGPAVKHVRPGERVIVPAASGCGACAYCTEGYYALCTSEHSPFVEGAQAEYVRVPYATVGLRAIPPGMTDEVALTLTDIFPTGYFGAELADVQAGEAVAVFGAGPVGLFAMHAARLKGASRIFALDPEPARLELAARQGFHPIDLREEEEAAAALRSLTRGYGVDACIEAVGLDALDREGRADPIAALKAAIAATKPGGQIGVVGVYAAPVDGFPLGEVFDKNLTIRAGISNHLRYIPKLMQIVQAGLLDPTFVYTGSAELEDIARAYADFDRHAHVKLAIHTPAGRAIRARVTDLVWEPMEVNFPHSER